MHKNIILISGAGQLGSRYLQGMISCQIPLTIYLHDISLESLDTAKNRWAEVSGQGSLHEVKYVSSLDQISKKIDLVIVSTTAAIRPNLISEINKHSKVRYWILEKILAQSIEGLDQISNIIGEEENAWVNTPRRIMPWYKEIKVSFGLDSPISMNLNASNWGLACNSIHYIDLFSWLTGENLIEVNTSDLNESWFESKRIMNWEINGKLTIKYSNGSILTLNSESKEINSEICIKNDSYEWKIVESKGIAERSDGLKINGKLSFQSELTSKLVETILQNGISDLPILSESILQHKIFIKSMLGHWNKSNNRNDKIVPIT